METPRIPIEAGTVIGGRYTVESLLGRGGMASVYRASDVPLGRSVALKVFEIDTEATAGLGRESSEIRLLASLNHHALVTLFDASVDGADRPFLVMELVEGPTLAERIARGPVAEIDVAQLLVDLAEALHVVHGNGVVHRDVKPANILLNPSALPAIEFRAKLSDFGIAYLIDSTRLTMPGTIIGTAAYLSPEQASGQAPDSPADIYSLGLVTLEALTGVRAFEGTMVESLSARLVSDPEVPSTLRPGWVALLTRMTARDPDDRPTALEVVELARQLERDVYASPASAPAVVDAGITEPMDPPTAVLPVEQTAAVTAEQPGEATTVLPVESTTVLPVESTTILPVDTTTVLPGSPDDGAQAAAPVERRRHRGRIAAAVVVAVLLVVGAGSFVLVTALQDPGTETSEPVPLPANEGDLGTHLDDLMESVTP